VRAAAAYLLGAVLLQYALGIVTVLRFGLAPPPMAEAVGDRHATPDGSADPGDRPRIWFAHAARYRASAGQITASAA
jgi:hypothetical protein